MDSRLLVILVLLAAGTAAGAQPRSLGGVFSFSGADIIYQHKVRNSDFIEIGAGIDADGVLAGKTLFPGAELTFGYRLVFLEKEYEAGTLAVYAGPGAVAGFVRNREKYGILAGISGELALEYRFRLPVIFSVGIAPVLGFHLNRSDDGSQNLDAYTNGLKYSYFPRVGIRYSF